MRLFLLALCFPFFVFGQSTQTLAQDRQSKTAARTPAVSAPAEAAAPEEIPADLSGSTEINVKNAEIAAIIRIFSKKTKRNYILDERVKGKVSIYLPGKVSSDEAVKILDSVLSLKGFSAVPIADNLWKVIPAKEAKQSTIPTLTDQMPDSPSAAMVTRLVNLKFIGADEAKQLITPLISADGLLNAYTGTNSLILIDSEDNISRLLKIIESLDVPFSDREMSIIPVKHADALDLATKLGEILGLGTSGQDAGASRSGTDTGLDLIRARLKEAAVNSSTNAANTGRSADGSAGGSAASSTVAARSREPKIVPDERTNSIIVVADEETTARIRALVDQLDSEVDMSGRRYYVYRCKYASAEDLAEVLSGATPSSGSDSSRTLSSQGAGGSDSIFGGAGSGMGSSRGGSTYNRNRDSQSQRTQQRLQNQQRLPGQSRSGASGGGAGGGFNLGEDVSITADPSTNSLIIHADKGEYNKVMDLLKQLDIKRRQVLVEAMLLEVALDAGMSASTQFLGSAGGKDGGVFAKSDFNSNLEALLSDPTQLSNFSVAAASSGTLTLPGDITIPTQTILLSAAQSNSNVNVLSAPTILATDNEPAEIVVGQNVPFLASTSTSGDNLNNTFNQIDRQDVGITLRLTPQISSGDSVRLEIFTEVSNVVASTLASELGPTTTVRTSETSIITKDNQMVVIGGLMADDVNETTTGIPFFKDIPVLGHLFRDSAESHRRTNLLIFITPRIVKDQFDARDTTMERRDQLSEEMRNGEIYPSRDEILYSDNIDKVSEVSSSKSEKMGTIRGPADANSGAAKIVAKDAPIELEISPKLPETKSGAEALGSLSNSASTDAGVYVILELKQKALIDNLPFTVRKKGDKLALLIPMESSAFSKNFFKAGANYSYLAQADQSLNFQAVAVLPSEQETKTFLSDPAIEFYTLSPHEILNLGKGPWLVQGK